MSWENPERSKGTTKLYVLLYDNARPHIAVPVQTYLETLKWEVLTKPKRITNFDLKEIYL